jgi:mRNA-decapping enzyme subunit 2
MTSTTKTLDEALSEVEARFLYNLPKEELSSAERLFFQIEQAYWYYGETCIVVNVKVDSHACGFVAILFVVQCPSDESSSEDFKADRYSNLPHFASLKSFAQKIFTHCSLLTGKSDSFQELFADYSSYKAKIPVCGCILLNKSMSKVVLVCVWNGNSWMFPRGKINQRYLLFVLLLSRGKD